MPGRDSRSNGGAPSGRFTPVSTSGALDAAAPGGGREATIEGLTVALGRLRRGAAALKAENHELRSEVAGLQLATPHRRGGDAPIRELGKLVEIALPTGSGAAGAARMVVAHCLTGLVAQRILEDVELLVSELVTNSLEHGQLGDDDTVLVRVYLAEDTLRLEIENPRAVGLVASGHSGRRSGDGGFGLELVDRLATRWGVSRDGSTIAWFEMGRA